MKASITGGFGVPGDNDNEKKRVMEFCAEKGLCVGNTYLEHKSLHKYPKVARGQDGVEIKSMIYLVLVKKDMVRYVKDVSAVSRTGEASQITMLHCIKSG